MQPRFVVPEQPRDGFVLGLAPGHQALPVQALDLQRAEQRLAAGIVPAVATPAHRTRDAVLLEHVPERRHWRTGCPGRCETAARPACPGGA